MDVYRQIIENGGEMTMPRHVSIRKRQKDSKSEPRNICHRRVRNRWNEQQAFFDDDANGPVVDTEEDHDDFAIRADDSDIECDAAGEDDD